MPPRDADNRPLLPLTPLVFQVLLALADDNRHGYGIIREIDRRSDGLIRLRTGTLYLLLRRLLSRGFIEESDKRPSPDRDDERRRYYRLTPLGRTVLKAETARLRGVLDVARAKRVFSRT